MTKTSSFYAGIVLVYKFHDIVFKDLCCLAYFNKFSSLLQLKPESHEANLLAANALAANKLANSLSVTGYSLLAGSTGLLIYSPLIKLNMFNFINY